MGEAKVNKMSALAPLCLCRNHGIQQVCYMSHYHMLNPVEHVEMTKHTPDLL